jgi:quercetin dioxygenase-like cupin family protein
MFLLAIAPGGAVGTHVHHGNAFSILEGSITLEVAGKFPLTRKPGDSGHMPPWLVFMWPRRVNP